MNTCTTDRLNVDYDADSAVYRVAARALARGCVSVQAPALRTRTADACGGLRATHDLYLSPEGRFAIVVA